MVVASGRDLEELPRGHRERLRWFAEREGSVTGWPGRMPDGSFLVTAPKGIFKPKELAYALSVRVMLDSRYDDGEVFTRPDGSWFFSYHQEGLDPARRDEEYANVGLMRCVQERVPVGVLRELPRRSKDKVSYEVLGLAVPAGWQDGFFFFESWPAPEGGGGRDTATEVALAVAAQQVDEAPEVVAPGEEYDERVRVLRAVVERRGQGGFRAALLDAYGGRCAVTGVDVEDVLEAAHVLPYRGPESHAVTNGLLLRADVHTLFDLYLLGVEPVSRTVRLAGGLRSSPYAGLHGLVLGEPSDPGQRPSRAALEVAWERFVQAERRRGQAAAG